MSILDIFKPKKCACGNKGWIERKSTKEILCIPCLKKQIPKQEFDDLYEKWENLITAYG